MGQINVEPGRQGDRPMSQQSLSQRHERGTKHGLGLKRENGEARAGLGRARIPAWLLATVPLCGIKEKERKAALRPSREAEGK